MTTHMNVAAASKTTAAAASFARPLVTAAWTTFTALTVSSSDALAVFGARETEAILRDPDMRAAIAAGEQDEAAGDLVSLEDFRRELGLS